MKAALLFLVLFRLFYFTAIAQTAVKQEFRGVWIATVDNIDWPDSPTINSDEQKAAFIKLLDTHKANGMNVMIVQVRPAADAFYPSPFEPWSQWLTGVQGRGPEPYYDPLEFMISETHKRGMQFHAWINPYRAVLDIYRSSLIPDHITKLQPEWFISYGGKKYFDPGNKNVQYYVSAVIRDIVVRYNTDAIHFDDYFYPYPLAGQTFNDNASYKKNGNGLGRADWRRSNTDSIISLISRTIKEVKPACQFGISPFGVWRNRSSDPRGSNTRGLEGYDELYADVLLWLKKGWIDYVAPQLYWEFEHRLVPFDVLADWWAQHSFGKNCYIGIGYYKAGSNDAWRDKTQLPRQIEKIRATPGLQGMAFYSSRIFDKNPNGWNDSLRLNYFKDSATAPILR